MALIDERFESCSDLSIHGLHQIGRLHGSTKRKALFWALLFVSAMGLLGYQVYRLGAYRMTYPLTVTRKVASGPVDFPTVTFCSLGLIKKSIASKIPVFKEMEKVMNQYGDPDQQRKKRELLVHTVLDQDILTEATSNATQVEHNVTDKCATDNESRQPIAYEDGLQDIIHMTDTQVALLSDTASDKSFVADISAVGELNSRTKRSAAAVSCNGFFACYQTSIMTTVVNNLAYRNNCIDLCGQRGDVGYTFYKTSAPLTCCICYSSDCCTSALRSSYNPVASSPGVSITMTGGKLAVCNDLFSTSTFGSGDKAAPYYERISVTYTCSSGNFDAQLHTSVVYTCQSTGLWDPAFSPCLGFCPNQFVSTSGSISPGPYAPASYTFSCNPGWMTTSNQAADIYTCSGGIWNKPFIPCIATCANIFVLTTGSVGSPPYTSGSYVFSCKSNYLTIDQLPSQAYLCSNENWDRQFSPCFAVCPTIFDATGNVDNTPPYMGFPTVHSFTCIPGYLLPTYATSQQYSCQTNGLWSPSLFVGCIKECQQIIRTQNAFQISYSGPLIHNLVPSGYQAAFACATNYSIIGTHLTSKCSNGSWDLARSQYPQCLADCNIINPKSLFPQLQVAYNYRNRLIHGSLATFSCNASLHFYGDFPNTTCVNGTWDVAVDDFPICLEQQVVFYSANALSNIDNDNSTKKDNFAAGAALMDMIPYIMSNLSESMKVSMGFTRDDNLVSCTFNNRICDKSTEIFAFNDNSMGNCYSFNHKYLNESLMIDRSGEQLGLHWILDTKLDEFLSIVTASGIKLIIHQKFAPIFPNAMGTTVSPGFNYNFALRKEREFKLETPLSVCYESPPRAKYFYLANSSYEIEGCQRSYYQSQINTNCSCAAPQFPHGNLNSLLCTLENRTCVGDSLNAAVSVQQNMLNYCPSACSSITEHMVITDTKNAANSKLMDALGFTKRYQRSNMISVKVFYQTLDTAEYCEELAYTTLNLSSDIGSSLGLLVGMSAISLVELLVVTIQIFKCHSKN